MLIPLSLYFTLSALVLRLAGAVRILNENSPALTTSTNHEQLAEFLRFFTQNIASEYGGEEGEGSALAYEALSRTSFFKHNIDFLRKAAKDVDPHAFQDTQEKKAFFINLYNTMLLDAILSLEKLPGRIESPSKFERKFAYQFKDQVISLGAIKHGVLRANSADPYDGHVYLDESQLPSLQLDKDPKVLATLFLTSGSSVPFRSYSSKGLDEELEQATNAFCESYVHVEDNRLLLSSFFKEYLEDFASSEEGLLKWLSNCVQNINKRILLYFAFQKGSYLSHSYTDPDMSLTLLIPNHERKLKVDIYTESLCNDSKNFFLNQLSISWPKLRSIMDLRIIPFGKASVTPIDDGTDFEFECQNGPLECQGNKVMSCAVALLPIGLQVPFFSCLYESENVSDFKPCAVKMAIPFGPIEECFSTVQGSKFLYENGEVTLKLLPKLFFVPTIVINKVYSSKDLDKSLSNFDGQFCDIYRDTFSRTDGIANPSGCKTKIEVYLESMNPDVQSFFLNQLEPTWNRLGNAMELSIIPFGNASWSSDNTDEVICPHGPLECYGNIIISCIVNLLPIQEQIDILRCMFTKRFPPLKGQECVKQEGIRWKEIGDCAEGADGPKLLKENSLLTSSLVPPLSSVPTVTINGVHNDTFKEWALNDLLALVCDTYYMARRSQAKAVLPLGCPVRVEIYIEMLCPDTHNFFLREFQPAWKKLKPLIDLHLIPFGKANVWKVSDGEDYEFECQNGPLECRGNKVMSCLIEYLPVDAQVDFIACMMRNKKPSFAGEKCAKELRVSWDPIRRCSTTPEGSHLLYQNGVRTMALKPTLFFVPTVTVNGFYDRIELQKSLKDLESQICDAYLGTLSRTEKVLTPKGCRGKLEVLLNLSSESTGDFVNNQLRPSWMKFSRLFTMEVFAVGSDDSTKDSDEPQKRGEGDIFSQRKIQTCNLVKTTNCASSLFGGDVTLELLTCVYEEIRPSCGRYEECCGSIGIPWEKIFSCSQGSKGLELTDEADSIQKSLLTRDQKTPRLPAVTINKFVGEEKRKNGTTEQDLQSLICTSFYDPSPASSKTWRPGGCPVTIEVFLSALCPDAKKFFLRELQPAWRRLKDILDVRIIPFGKASASINSTTEKYEFECQNGPAECHGNKILSCVVKYYSTEEQVEAIACMLQVQVSTSQGQKCSKELGLDWEVISNCMDQESSSLLFNNGEKTKELRPSLFYVPTVTINQFYNRNQLRSTLKDLSGFICNVYLNTDDGYSGKIPEGCKVKVLVYWRYLDEEMKNFFAFHAEEFWKHFKQVVNLRFLPLPNSATQELEGDLKEASPGELDNCTSPDDPCYHPRFMGCLASLHGVEIQMEVMACIMSQSEPKDAYNSCLEEFDLAAQEMKDCISSQDSQSFLEENLSKYEEVKHLQGRLPLVIVEKVIIRDYSQLTGLVCKKYQGPKPSKCHQREDS